MHPDQYIDIYM